MPMIYPTIQSAWCRFSPKPCWGTAGAAKVILPCSRPGVDQAPATRCLIPSVYRSSRFMPADKVPVFLPSSAGTARRRDKRIRVNTLQVLAWIKHRVSSAKLEAFNAAISRIVKRGCGYRDLEYLSLKIRQEAASCRPAADPTKLFRWILSC